MTRLIEQQLTEVRAPNSGDGLDPAYVDTSLVVWGASSVLQNIREALENDIELRPLVTQEYIDELEAAFRCGEKVIYHDDVEAIKRDMSLLDDELLVELRGTVGYIAPHFGVDLQLPIPSEEVTDD